MTAFGEIPPPVVLPKVYLYCAGQYSGPSDDYLMIAVAEDGDGLGSHICSHPSFAMGDLHNQPRRHEAYEAKFGGWGDRRFYEVIQIPVGESPPEAVMDAIRKKNAEAAAEGGAR